MADSSNPHQPSPSNNDYDYDRTGMNLYGGASPPPPPQQQGQYGGAQQQHQQQQAQWGPPPPPPVYPYGNGADANHGGAHTMGMPPPQGVVQGVPQQGIPVSTFRVPPIPIHESPKWTNRAPPRHWTGWHVDFFDPVDGTKGSWTTRGSKGRTHHHTADIAVMQCKLPVYYRAPDGSTQVRMCGEKVNFGYNIPEHNDTLEKHCRLHHSIVNPPAGWQKTREWRAPLLPCSDFSTLCDCIWCEPCFLARVAGAMSVQTVDGITPYLAEPSSNAPVGPTSECCQCCCLQAFMLPFMIIPFFWCMFFCGEHCIVCPTQMLRWELIKKEKIDEGNCESKCITVWCCPCALVQVHRELRLASGVNPGTTCCEMPNDVTTDPMFPRPRLQDVLQANPNSTQVMN